MRTIQRIFLVFVPTLLATLPAAAQLPDSALGSDGELYVARVGSYGDLFPDQDVQDAETPVLALDIVPADGRASRWLVPGTADGRTESRPTLLYEQRSDSIILMWHSIGGNGLRIDFATRNAEGGWSAVRKLLDDDGRVVKLGRAPLAVVTQDAFDLPVSDEETLSTTRWVIHLVYSAGDSLFYTPLVFVEGLHVGWIESIDLNGAYLRGPEGVEVPSSGVSENLLQALSLHVTDDQGAVLVAFADATSSRIGALEIGLPPLSIELLGDSVRDLIFANADIYDPGDISSFSDTIGAQLIAIGIHVELHPGIVEFAADQVREWLEASAADYGYAGFEDLGNDARELAIYLTDSVTAAMVADPATGDEILEIDLGDFLEALESDSILNRLLDVKVRADRAAPDIGKGTAAIYTSRDGRDLMVAWSPSAGGKILYVESRVRSAGGAWSETRSLKLNEGLTAEQALELLQQKIR